MNQKKIIIIPGGPWLAGSYLDNLPPINDYTKIRLTLLNHEGTYNSSTRTDIPQLQSNILKEIQKIMMHESSTTLMAHSFGAWLLGSIIDQLPKNKIEKVLLLDMPFGTERNKFFTKEISRITPPAANSSNKTFKDYLGEILYLYFKDHRYHKGFFDEVFWEGNQDLSFDNQSIANAIEKLKSLEKKIYYINGEGDNLIKESDIEWLSKQRNYFEIQSSGHFPMLENPINFSKVLSDILSK